MFDGDVRGGTRGKSTAKSDDYVLAMPGVLLVFRGFTDLFCFFCGYIGLPHPLFCCGGVVIYFYF